MDEKELQAAMEQPEAEPLPGAEQSRVADSADGAGGGEAGGALDGPETPAVPADDEKAEAVDGESGEATGAATAGAVDGPETPLVAASDEKAEAVDGESGEAAKAGTAGAIDGPETVLTASPDDALEAVEVAPGDSAETTKTSDLPEEAQVSLSAEQLLGEQEQPAAAADTQAAELKAVLEAIIYLLNEPMPVAQIAQALGRDVKVVEPVLRQLAEESNRPDRGIFFREVAGGYQMATKPEHHEILRAFVQNLKQPLKLSQAALETLAVIAYKQPITMPEILEIRGVQGGGVVKTLIDRKLITTAGRKNVIGKPMLYKTTKEFLTQFGLRDVQELPSLKEFEEIRRQSMADDEIEVPAAAVPAAESQVEVPPAPETAPETEAEPTAAPEPAAEPPKEENA